MLNYSSEHGKLSEGSGSRSLSFRKIFIISFTTSNWFCIFSPLQIRIVQDLFNFTADSIHYRENLYDV